MGDFHYFLVYVYVLSAQTGLLSVSSLQWDPQGSPQTSLSATLLPHGAPHPGQTLHRSSVPDTEGFHLGKPDPYDLYEKSRAIYESRRKSELLVGGVF